MTTSHGHPPRRGVGTLVGAAIGALALVAGFVFGGDARSAVVVFEGGPSPVVYPKQNNKLVFDHAYHVRKADDAKKVKGEGLSCEFCHEKISEQSRADETDIPGHEVCENCHADWIGTDAEPAPAKDCARCHADIKPRGPYTGAVGLDIPPPNVRFAHKQHVEADVGCESAGCHTNVRRKGLATRDDFPTMDRCIACHEDREVATTCLTCHPSDPADKKRIRTRFASGELVPVRYHGASIHTGDFLRDHALPAQREPGYCRNCHSDDECQKCHNGVGLNVRYHPGDFLQQHSTRAKIDDHRCTSCHRLQTFCLNCHVQSGVASVVDVRTGETTRRTVRVGANGVANGPHPMAADGWLSPGSRNFHGFFAQRAIQSCVGCHQEQTCIRCHASGFGAGGRSFGGNPHGPNPERLKGTAVSQNVARACLKCHSPLDPSWR